MDRPAGVLVGEWLKDEDPYYERIGRICYASRHGDRWSRGWFCVLAPQTGKCKWDTLERLAYDAPLTEEDLGWMRHSLELEDLAEETPRKAPGTVLTASGSLMAAYDTSNTPGLYLGNGVFEHHAAVDNLHTEACLIDLWRHR